MGDTELFSIDRKSGMIRTLKPLDRETTARHQIVVGTEENMNEGPGATTTVEVFVDVSMRAFVRNDLCGHVRVRTIDPDVLNTMGARRLDASWSYVFRHPEQSELSGFLI